MRNYRVYIVDTNGLSTTFIARCTNDSARDAFISGLIQVFPIREMEVVEVFA